VTFVRPVLGERELQKLDSLDFSELRGEFLEQTISFRRQILNHVRVK
jgi:hypothetical protein